MALIHGTTTSTETVHPRAHTSLLIDRPVGNLPCWRWQLDARARRRPTDSARRGARSDRAARRRHPEGRGLRLVEPAGGRGVPHEVRLARLGDRLPVAGLAVHDRRRAV
eukprot:1818381-Prymnesium_polylepis.1